MKYTIVFLAIILFSLKTTAQVGYQIAGQSISQLQQEPVLAFRIPSLPDFQNIITVTEAAPSLSAVFKNYSPTSSTAMPKAWAYEDLAFFCKIEVDIEKTTKLPVKFRIGEVQQVEKMEGKLK